MMNNNFSVTDSRHFGFLNPVPGQGGRRGVRGKKERREREEREEGRE